MNEALFEELLESVREGAAIFQDKKQPSRQLVKTMEHPIYRVLAFEIVGPYTLQVAFDDGTNQVIDFQSVLAGHYFGPLRDQKLFAQVEIDPEVHTLVWPNGADFDPLTLHNWPEYIDELNALAKSWKERESEPT